MKWTRTLRCSAVVIVAAAAALVWPAGRARGMGFILGESKDELKLKYDVAVAEAVTDERGTVLVTVALTLADEGRLKPLDDVQLVVQSRERHKDGSYGADLVVSIDMRPAADGKRVGRVQLLKDLAERAEIQLNTHTMDGKKDMTTRLHHVIPVANYLKDAAGARPAAATKPASPSRGR